MIEADIVAGIQHGVPSSPMTVAIAIFCARWLILALIIPLFVLWYRRPSQRFHHAVCEAGWSLLVSVLITAGLSHVINRLRPFLASPVPGSPIVALIPQPLNTSFPSGHTAAAVAITAAIFFVDRRLGMFAFTIALLVAFGRIAVGVHYPTDILGGIIVGLVSFGIVRLCHAQLRARDLIDAEKHHYHP